MLVGMMTEAVLTPWLSDRDLALQNVRYVLAAAGKLAEDFQPAPDGFIADAGPAGARRGRRAARATSRDDGAARGHRDGTFGLISRPADAGKGLDGVVAQGRGLLQPGHRDPGAHGGGRHEHGGRR